MELDMRYAVTADGVRIAWGSAGAGQPLLRVPNPPFAHSRLEWRQGAFFDEICRNRRVITFDPRGTGMSERDVADYSLEARLLDIDAVVESLGLDTFALHGIWQSGPLVIAYAARNPHRVRRLVLDDTFANGRIIHESPGVRALRALQSDWDEMLEHIAFTYAGYGGEDARRYAQFLRECTTKEAAQRMLAAFESVDMTGELPRITAPTLIVQHRGIRVMSPQHVQEMATLIPDARLLLLEGKESDDLEAFVSALTEFLGDDAPPGSAVPPSAFRTVLFTDLVGHTELMRRLGDEQGREVLREHERMTRDLLRQHGGAEVKTMGDGFMASFSSVTNAMDCAIALQRAFDAWNSGRAHQSARLHVRVGLNAGEPIEEHGDLFGSTVILASRVAARAGAGEILIPEPLRHLLSGKSYAYVDRGEAILKGFEDAVRLFEVRWRDATPTDVS
jgi:class 3 adenylate cyclase